MPLYNVQVFGSQIVRAAGADEVEVTDTKLIWIPPFDDPRRLEVARLFWQGVKVIRGIGNLELKANTIATETLASSIAPGFAAGTTFVQGSRWIGQYPWWDTLESHDFAYTFGVEYTNVSAPAEPELLRVRAIADDDYSRVEVVTCVTIQGMRI